MSEELATVTATATLRGSRLLVGEGRVVVLWDMVSLTIALALLAPRGHEPDV